MISMYHMIPMYHMISYRQQRLRCGFPPRELHAPSDSSQPLNLANGDRVLVDIISDQSEQPQKGQELEAAAQDDSSSQSVSSESEEATASECTKWCVLNRIKQLVVM